MDSENGFPGGPPARSRIVMMSARDWEALGDDAKHVEDGRYYMLEPGSRGSRVVEVQFTDRKPRRTRAGSRSRQARGS